MSHDNDDLDPEDQLAALKAQLDQAAAMAPELARMARAWCEAFLAEGFSDAEALYLTAVQMKDTPGAPPS